MTKDLLKQLFLYVTFFPKEVIRIQPLVEQIKSNAPLFDRKTSPGHITASGIVLSSDLMLMIRHPFIGKWLQPGGHVESGETPVQAAIREVEEETGISAELHPWHQWNQFPIDIDIHSISANDRKFEPSHIHYDFRYLLTHSGELGVGEHSSAWHNISDITEPNLTALVKKIRELLPFVEN
ncbi:MAG: NUDIX hydrolase [Burkholderiaceae bacterium]